MSIIARLLFAFGSAIVVASGAAHPAVAQGCGGSFPAYHKCGTTGSPGLPGAVPDVTGPAFAAIRLTLTQGAPVTTSDVTGATMLYLEPYNGNSLSLYDGMSTWTTLAVPASTLSIPATQTQAGTLSATTTVTGLTSTTGMVVGQQITGANIPANTTIAAIASGTAITMNNAATGSGATSLTFKLAPNTLYDVFALNLNGTVILVWGPAWTNDTTRSAAVVLQDGVEVKSFETARRLLGTVRTISVAGQLEDSHTRRWVSNRYNEQPRAMWVTEVAANWTHNSATFRQANANPSNQLDYVVTVNRTVNATAMGIASNATVSGNNVASTGIGVDSTTNDSAFMRVSAANLGANSQLPATSLYSGAPGVGRHTLVWLEAEYPGTNANATTWVGTNTIGAIETTGIFGSVSN